MNCILIAPLIQCFRVNKAVFIPVYVTKFYIKCKNYIHKNLYTRKYGFRHVNDILRISKCNKYSLTFI